MTDHSDWEFFQDEGYFGMWCVREKGARRFGEGFHTVSEEEAEALASALSSQSLSLSEAREEIERLKADIAVKAKLLTKSAKETRAFWDALIPKGGRCRDCADFDGRCQGDGPPCDPQAHALENLAKLKSALSDLSSLRKGAEVAVKPVVWEKYWGGSNDDIPSWRASTPVGLTLDVDFAGERLEKHSDADPVRLAAKQAEAFAWYETRIRSALITENATPKDGVSETAAQMKLVSGSREDKP